MPLFRTVPSDSLPHWLLENVFTILLIVLMGTSSYMLKRTLDDLKTSVDRLADATAAQDVRLENHGTRINNLRTDMKNLDDKLDEHSDRWTDLYRQGFMSQK